MNANQSAIRIKSFDVLKFFAIFLVLWGHSIQYLTSGEFIDKPVYIYIYSFHMPLFMMVAGYFAPSSMNLPPVTFMKKKFIQLLLPWLTWGICSIGVVYISHLLHGQAQSFKDVFFIMRDSLWFLKSLFLCYLIAYWGKRFISNMYLVAIVTIAFVQIVHYYVLPIMYPCFLVGMYLRLKDVQWQRNSMTLFVFSLLSFVVLLFYWDKSFWDYIVFNFTTVFIKNEHYPLIYLYREIYRILIGIAGSLSFIFLFHLLFRRKINFESVRCLL